MIKVLFFGDIVGKLGRRAITEILPEYKKKYKPDLIIANGENLAHGAGVTMDTVDEVFKAGVNFLTGGNHIFKKKGYEDVFTQFENKIVRPANYPNGVAGRGYATLKIKNKRVCVVNLIGRVFMPENFENPFYEFDRIEKLLKLAKNDIVVVDFHAEATSEKSAFGWYADGRASAVIGTHTHVPTCDGRILPCGSAYISDAGMVGAKNSILGVEKEGPLNMFLTQLPTNFERPEEGLVQVGAVLVEIDEDSARAKKIERVDKEVQI